MTARTNTVSVYREHLAKSWGIDPVATTDEVYAMLEAEQQVQLQRWQEELLATDDAHRHQAFYAWMAGPARLGPVHSLKWMEILSGGVWAAAVLQRQGPTGRILDLGCNVGYWTTWFARQHGGGVIGIDACEAAVAMGWDACSEQGLDAELRVGDFTVMGVEESFDAVVSLQGLTRHFHAGDHNVLGSATGCLRRHGWLIVVDEMPGERADYEAAFARSGLSLRAAGMVGGMGIDQQWKAYTGLVLRKDGGGGGASLADAESVVDQMWKAFSDSASADCDDWTRRNSAYWWGEGAEVVAAL